MMGEWKNKKKKLLESNNKNEKTTAWRIGIEGKNDIIRNRLWV